MVTLFLVFKKALLLLNEVAGLFRVPRDRIGIVDVSWQRGQGLEVLRWPSRIVDPVIVFDVDTTTGLTLEIAARELERVLGRQVYAAGTLSELGRAGLSALDYVVDPERGEVVRNTIEAFPGLLSRVPMVRYVTVWRFGEVDAVEALSRAIAGEREIDDVRCGERDRSCEKLAIALSWVLGRPALLLERSHRLRLFAALEGIGGGSRLMRYARERLERAVRHLAGETRIARVSEVARFVPRWCLEKQLGFGSHAVRSGLRLLAAYRSVFEPAPTLLLVDGEGRAAPLCLSSMLPLYAFLDMAIHVARAPETWARSGDWISLRTVVGRIERVAEIPEI